MSECSIGQGCVRQRGAIAITSGSSCCNQALAQACAVSSPSLRVEQLSSDKRVPSDASQNTHDSQGLIWRGQTDVIVRLIKGWDPTLGSASALQKLSMPDQQEFAKELGQFEYYIPFNSRLRSIHVGDHVAIATRSTSGKHTRNPWRWGSTNVRICHRRIARPQRLPLV